MKQEFIDYELNLKMFIDYGADAHARHLVGEPIKPEGYDEYKVVQEKLLLKNEKKETKNQKIEQITETYEVKGYVFDADGIPEYLTADDVYNGRQNPEWLKKHTKPEAEAKPQTKLEKTIKDEKVMEEVVYNRYSGLEKYLSESDRQKDIVNPEWIMEHGK